MLFSDFLWGVVPILLIELFAAIFGTIYVRSNPRDKSAKLLVIFLWFTLAHELFGCYAAVSYFLKPEILSFTKGTVFEKNLWESNIYTLINFMVYVTYVKMQLTDNLQRKIINWFLVLFITTSVVNLLTSDVFFTAISSFTFVSGVLVLLPTIGLYYYQLLRSDEVLRIGKLLPFYVTVGTIILHICLTPFFIYSNYFSADENLDFANTYTFAIRIINLFVYSIYILGFIVCRRKKSLY